MTNLRPPCVIEVEGSDRLMPDRQDQVPQIGSGEPSRHVWDELCIESQIDCVGTLPSPQAVLHHTSHSRRRRHRLAVAARVNRGTAIYIAILLSLATIAALQGVPVFSGLRQVLHMVEQVFRPNSPARSLDALGNAGTVQFRRLAGMDTTGTPATTVEAVERLPQDGLMPHNRSTSPGHDDHPCEGLVASDTGIEEGINLEPVALDLAHQAEEEKEDFSEAEREEDEEQREEREEVLEEPDYVGNPGEYVDGSEEEEEQREQRVEDEEQSEWREEDEEQWEEEQDGEQEGIQFVGNPDHLNVHDEDFQRDYQISRAASIRLNEDNEVLQGLLDLREYASREARRTDIDCLLSIPIDQKHLDDGSPKCTICIDTFALGEIAKQTPCLHLYHEDCILPWLSSHSVCPVCRFELPTEGPKEE